MDLQDLREQIHNSCPVAVRIERRIRGQRTHRGLDGSAGLRPRRRGPRRLSPAQRPHRRQRRGRELHDGGDRILPATSPGGPSLSARARDTEANRPRRVSCDFVYSAEDDCWYLAQKGQQALLPAEFSGWAACSPHDGVAHATTAHRTFRRWSGHGPAARFPPEQTTAGGRCSVCIVDPRSGTMQFAEVRLPAPPPPALPLSEADQSTAPSVS